MTSTCPIPTAMWSGRGMDPRGPVVANFGVGTEPEAVAIDPTSHVAFVANYASGTLWWRRVQSEPAAEL